LRPDGRLQAWWVANDGESSMKTTLRRIGPASTPEPAPTVATAGAGGAQK